ncbi:phage portal protein [Brevundimonas sp. TWP1-2-1b1]|uniref:phage portal protein n=1 Tax=unclassified Brevundimonas TaxID=2622653 RepID=UPI003CF40EA3
MVSIRWPFGQAGRVRAPEAKESRAGGVIALSGVGRPRWTPNDYASLAREGYQKNAVAYRCIRMIAEAAAAAPFAVFVEGVRDEAHPLAKLIRRPNSEQSGAELMEAVYGALQVSGNAYVEATGDADGDGAPDELWALRSDRVKVVPGRSGWPEAWDYSVDGRSVRIGRAADGWAPVMHLKLWHPLDDWYGLSPMEAAAQGVDAHNAAGAWNKALLDNAARPSGALVYGARNGERLTDGQFEALKDQLSNVYAGATNAGRPILLEGGMDWKPLSLTPAEMDFTAGKHAAAREIALAFGVPPQLLGIPGDATYANYREANAAFWRQTVIPLVRKAAGAMTGWLGERFAGCEVRADLEAVAALQPERDALWARLEGASFLTDEERRRMAGVGGMTEHQIRRVPTALLIAVVVQTVGGLVWAGGAAARIATLEQRVGEQRLVAERLARLEVQGEATAAAVERIERRLEGAK